MSKSMPMLIAATVAALSWASAASLSAQTMAPQPGEARCADNGMGSPINIEGTDPVRTHPLMPHYQVMPLSIRNTAAGLTLGVEGDHVLQVGAKRLALKGVQIRTPSEHTVMGQRFPMEIQLVHEGAEGLPAVVSVFVAAGDSHPAVEEIWPHLPIERGQSNMRPDIRINMRDLLPGNTAYWRYQGSLTDTPCTPGTAWYVLKSPIQMSAAQISAAQALQGTNAAPLMPRHHRLILDTAQ